MPPLPPRTSKIASGLMLLILDWTLMIPPPPPPAQSSHVPLFCVPRHSSSFAPGSNGVHWFAAFAHTLPRSPPRFLHVCPRSASHSAFVEHGVQLQGPQRPPLHV